MTTDKVKALGLFDVIKNMNVGKEQLTEESAISIRTMDW